MKPLQKAPKPKINELVERPPIVAVLGHVDHGKTTLLDAIRKSKIAQKEFGGITQRIGAYQVEFKGKKITFIDTPGHEAFSKIRSRGAQATDIALLVVAADDGVMPQTKESIAHIKEANVPLIVVINKIDLPQANVEKVKQQLAENNILVEGYGGNVVTVSVSAKTGQGINELLEMVILVAALEELKADLNATAQGVIIEATLDKFKGPTATILIKQGILKIGDQVKTGETFGKVRAMLDFNGQALKEAYPSTPVEVSGLENVPKVGETLLVTNTLPEKVTASTPEAVDRRLSLLEPDQIRLILKADGQGSLEALTASIENLFKETKKVKFILKETGDITESDVLLASAAKALLIGFNVRITPNAEELAKEEKVLFKVYNLIYELLEELKEGIESEKEIKLPVSGKAKVIALFDSKIGRVAGCKIEEGNLSLKDKVKVLRDDQEVGSSRIKSLRYGQESIKAAAVGKECGLVFEDKIEFAIGDIIESYGI